MKRSFLNLVKDSGAVILLLLMVLALTGCGHKNARILNGYEVDDQDYPVADKIYLNGKAYEIAPVDLENRLDLQTAIECELDYELKGDQLVLELPNVFDTCRWASHPNIRRFIPEDVQNCGEGEEFYIPGKKLEDYPDTTELYFEMRKDPSREGELLSFPVYGVDESGEPIMPPGIHLAFFPKGARMTRYTLNFEGLEIPDVLEFKLKRYVMGLAILTDHSTIQDTWFYSHDSIAFYRLRINLKKQDDSYQALKPSGFSEGYQLDEKGFPLVDKIYVNGQVQDIRPIDIRARRMRSFSFEDILHYKLDGDKLVVELPNVFAECRWLVRPNIRYLEGEPIVEDRQLASGKTWADYTDIEAIEMEGFTCTPSPDYTRFEMDFTGKKKPKYVEFALIETDTRIEDSVFVDRPDVKAIFYYYHEPIRLHQVRIILD